MARILLNQLILRRCILDRSCSTALGNFNSIIKDENNWKTELLSTMRIFPNFLNQKEEDSLFREVEPYMKRLRYEFSHWDDVSIHLAKY